MSNEIPDNYINFRNRGQREAGYHVVNPLHTAEIPGPVLIKTALRLERRKEGSFSSGRDARALLIAFANPRQMDRFLKADIQMETIIMRKLQYKWITLPLLNTVWPKSFKLRIQVD